MGPGLQVQIKVALITVRSLWHGDLESVTSIYFCGAELLVADFNIVAC